ncbi:MAG: FecR family protein [Niastella sp.]|uniref:FecR family protein n=1 Tax=Niastella sp. TaxID=1869183 RepID=UPI00389A7298
MKDRQDYLKYLLAQKKLTSEEEEWLLNYLNDKDISDIQKIAAEDFETDITYMKKSLDKVQSEAILEKIHSRIYIPTPTFTQVIRLHRMKLAIAALIIIIAGTGYWYLNKSMLFMPADQEIVITGKRKTVRLPDGSMITLEPNSRLMYPNRFTRNTREVELTGEAFFEVKPNHEKPFIVHTANIMATVLGTSFNVEAYPDGIAKVVVATGRVKVQTVNASNELQAVIINANQSVTYNITINEIEKRNVPEEAVYYKQRNSGRFSYAGVPVAKVIQEMERYYHTTVFLQGNMSGCVFYGYFRLNDNVERALSLVALSLNATVQKTTNNKGYIITGGNCR